jgi:hypothetical protein
MMLLWCSFVSSSMNDPLALDILANKEKMGQLRNDLGVIESSLTFINDFLRSMLDIHKANEKMLQLNFNSVDIFKCVLEPIRTMLATHDSVFEVLDPDYVSYSRLRL